MPGVEFSKKLTAQTLKEYHQQHLQRAEQVNLDVDLVACLGTETEAINQAPGYYQREGETLGWHGHLAENWGLVGQPVEALAFNRMADGQHPHLGEQLVRKQGLKDPWSDHAWHVRVASTVEKAGPDPLRVVQARDRRPKKLPALPMTEPVAAAEPTAPVATIPITEVSTKARRIQCRRFTDS